MKISTCKIASQEESQESLKSLLRSEASAKLLANNIKSSLRQSEVVKSLNLFVGFLLSEKTFQ